jgi:partner of Y14 and mago protein
MSRPPINPEKTIAGIAVDPRTLERVIPESKRSDGTVRKQIKIRPGFTPQEDVRRFRSTKQAQIDASSLPKGHIIGWAPPPSTTKPGATPGSGSASGTAALSKNAKKRQKQREKKAEALVVKDNWDDEDEEKGTDMAPAPAIKTTSTAIASDTGIGSSGTHTPEQTSLATAPDADNKDETTDELASELEKLEVR